jgi:hypothetical protein
MATKKSPTHVDSLPGCWWITSNRKQRSVTTPPLNEVFRMVLTAKPVRFRSAFAAIDT